MMTSVVIEIQNSTEGRNFSVMGNMSKKHEKTLKMPKKDFEMFHMVNLCELVEERETDIR